MEQNKSKPSACRLLGPLATNTSMDFGVLLLLCVGAEFGCSILILLGFLTRLASLILVINMCVALFLVLGLSGWGAQELAAIYLLIYLTLFYTGPGKFSLDAWWLWRDCKIEVE